MTPFSQIERLQRAIQLTDALGRHVNRQTKEPQQTDRLVAWPTDGLVNVLFQPLSSLHHFVILINLSVLSFVFSVVLDQVSGPLSSGCFLVKASEFEVDRQTCR